MTAFFIFLLSILVLCISCQVGGSAKLRYAPTTALPSQGDAKPTMPQRWRSPKSGLVTALNQLPRCQGVQYSATAMTGCQLNNYHDVRRQQQQMPDARVRPLPTPLGWWNQESQTKGERPQSCSTTGIRVQDVMSEPPVHSQHWSLNQLLAVSKKT